MMMIFRSIFMIFLLNLFILYGCTSIEKNQERISKGDTGYITELSGKQVLIKGTYYKITKDTKIQDLDGNAISYDELQFGMKIKPWYIGEMQESFPSKAEAKLLLIMSDQAGLAEQEAIITAVDFLKVSDLERFIVLDLQYNDKEDVYRIEMMKRSNLDTSFTVTVHKRTGEVMYE